MPEFSFDGKALEDDVVPDKAHHYSYTQLDLFLRCPEAYRRKYILKEPWPGTWQMTKGKAFHKSIELISMLGEEGASKAFDGFRVRAVAEDIQEKPADEQEALADLDTMYELAHEVHRQYKKVYISNARGMEYRFEINVGSVNVLGYMDLVTENGIIVDWKSGKNTIPEDAAVSSRQLVLYDFAYRTMFKETPEKLGLIWAGKLKSGPKIVERWAPPFQQENFDRLARAFEIMDKVIKNDGPWQGAAHGSWQCDQTKCPAWNTCGVRV